MPASASSHWQLLRHTCVVVLACVLAGVLCLWASPDVGSYPLIWLPAGVGVAATLRLGPAAWPGVLLSALLLTLLARHVSGLAPDTTRGVIDGLLVGLALCLQSALAARLLQPPGSALPALDTAAGVARFALIAAPLAAIFGGGGILLGAFLSDAIGSSGVTSALLAAWFGQWMGMLFATPLLLAAVGSTSPVWRGRAVAVAIATLLAAGIAFATGGATAAREQERQRLLFNSYAAGLSQSLVGEFDDVRGVAGALRYFLESKRSVEAEEFRRFSEAIGRRSPGVIGMGWAPRVMQGDVAAFEAAVRASVHPAFRLSSPAMGATGPLNADHAYPVTFVLPAAAQARLGVDLLRSQGGSEAIERARATGDVVAFPPRRALLGQPGELTLLFVAAVGPVSVVPGLPGFEGVVGVAAQPLLMARRLLERGETQSAMIHFLLEDVTSAEPVLLADLGAASEGATLEPYHRRLEVGGRILELTIAPTAGYLASQFSLGPLLLQVSASISAAFLLLFLVVLSARSARVERQFEDRTAELAARNRQLRNEIAEREAAEERERETQRSFLDGLAFAGIGSWDHDLDSGQLRGTSELFRMYGLPGTSTGMDFDTLLERVHPDDLPLYQEALEACTVGGGFLSLDLRVMHPGGRIRWISARARHRVDRAGHPHVVGVSWDITERVEASARAKLLAMAFDRGGEAMFISDPQFRMVEVNPAFAALTGIGQVLAPGMDVVEVFAERGNREQFRSYAAIALDRGGWQGEIWGRGAGGVPRPFWLVLAVVRDNSGEPSNYVGSFVDISDRKGAEEKIEFLAHHDALTGLPNRFSLQSRVDQALSQVTRAGDRLALLFIDMDRFKLINDSLGHDVGDQLLLEIARRLRASVRSSDIVARLGGDEFVVALPGAGDDDAIARMAEKLRQELSAPYNLRARLLHSSPSIGIAIAPEHGTTVETLMRNADAAMYRAKDLGRNNFQFFDQALSERARERLELAADLRGALEREEFLLHLQPQVRAEDGAYVAAEALIRWQHPQRGLVPPDQFIGVAEEFGLIDAIGDWALNAACRELASLNAQGIQDLRVCVNLSAKQLRDRELPARVAAAIAASGIKAADLELELTESMAMQDPQSTIALLKRLYDSGVGLAIDDFGTGYSSLSYLKMLPLHNIKLDRSFVRDIDAEPGGRAICSATVAMAHALGIKVVAEGVETEVQRDFLMALGCDYLQGWLFSKALPGPALAALIHARRREYGA